MPTPTPYPRRLHPADPTHLCSDHIEVEWYDGEHSPVDCIDYYHVDCPSCGFHGRMVIGDWYSHDDFDDVVFYDPDVANNI